MNESVVESISLENGLTLDILDAGRAVEGGWWLVHLIARIEVFLTPGLLDSVPDGDRLLGTLKQEYGEAIEYRTDLKKHFVSENDRHRVFQEFKDIIHREKRPYLSHPDFAKRFALSRIAELTRVTGGRC
ncbi:MAG: hypothetical protein ACQET7_08250 [Thermodesulfobacteriota bacterium]